MISAVMPMYVDARTMVKTAYDNIEVFRVGVGMHHVVAVPKAN